MSEHLPQHHETSSERAKSHESQEHQKNLQEQLEKRASEAHDNKEKLPELAHKAKEEALPTEAVRISETKSAEPSAQYVGRELKSLAFQRTLTRVRRQLSVPSRAFSKVIHQPVVTAVSKAGEQTVARPSGVLGGSLCAFIGSSVFFWASKHYGFRYNYLLFAVFFIAGFAIGLTIEMLTFIFHRRSKQV